MTADRNSVETILAEARAAVEAADLPANLQPIAFEKAVDLLSGMRVIAEPAAEVTDSDSAANGSGTPLTIDTSTAEAFVRSQPNVERPAEAVKAIAAWWFSQYGSSPITRMDIETIAEDIGVTIPDRPDATMRGMKHEGRDVFRSAGRGTFTPTRPHGELFFQSQYSVSKGRNAPPARDDAS